MGLFNKLIGNKENEASSGSSQVNWIPLKDLAQLDEIAKESNELPVAIFKHSTRCGISRMVLNGFEREFEYSDSQVKMYFLDLIAYRAISNEIAERFKVWHESPQLLVISKGEAVHHSSHSAISASAIGEFTA